MSGGRFTRLAPLEEARRHVPGGAPVGGAPGTVLPDLVPAARRLREEIRASGQPTGVATRDLVTQPHPRNLDAFRAARSPVPWLWLTERLVVVTWDDGGDQRTLLWSPSDHELDDAPGARRLLDRLPVRADLVTTVHGTVLEQLRAMGIAPEDVDHVAFDNLRRQDLRRLLGTTRPAPGLGDDPVQAWFPNATLLVQRSEWEAVLHPHPLQAAFYRTQTFENLRLDRVQVIDGDLLLGPGVALVCTPGGTHGNQSLVLHTDSGVAVVSGNGVMADSWAPEQSELAGVADHARETGLAVLPRAHTLEFASWQYGSMLAEAALADPGPDERFPFVLPNGELHPHVLAPGLRPTVSVARLTHGIVRPSHADTFARPSHADTLVR